MDFEEKLKRIGEIVDTMEKDNVSLDESLKLYGEGVKLCRSCQDELELTEGKITEIQKDGKEKELKIKKDNKEDEE